MRIQQRVIVKVVLSYRIVWHVVTHLCVLRVLQGIKLMKPLVLVMYNLALFLIVIRVWPIVPLSVKVAIRVIVWGRMVLLANYTVVTTPSTQIKIAMMVTQSREMAAPHYAKTKPISHVLVSTLIVPIPTLGVSILRR